jgi:hypothetical protein
MTASWAPDWLPRRQRRAVDRRLRELWRREVCSACGSPFKHNSRVASGFDVHGNITLAGECCIDRVVEVFELGLVSDRGYDFLTSRSAEAAVAQSGAPTSAQIAGKIAADQKLIERADALLAGVERRGGVGPVGNVGLLGHPWKDDDRKWFERNPSRAHRMRPPFPGEDEDETTKAPAGHARVMLLRQVEPGRRLKFDFYIRTNLLPLPDTEAVANALFEVAARREPMPSGQQAFHKLIGKYSPNGRADEA